VNYILATCVELGALFIQLYLCIQGGRILSTEDVIVTYYVDTLSHIMCSPARLCVVQQDYQLQVRTINFKWGQPPIQVCNALLSLVEYWYSSDQISRTELCALTFHDSLLL